MTFGFDDVEVSAHVESKINAQHNTSIDDVVEALDDLDKAVWHEDERGLRLLVRGRTASGRRLLVVLYPLDPTVGSWRLATAYPV